MLTVLQFDHVIIMIFYFWSTYNILCTGRYKQHSSQVFKLVIGMQIWLSQGPMLNCHLRRWPYCFGWFIVFNATFNNISVKSCRSVLLVKETGVPRENHFITQCGMGYISPWTRFELTTLVVIRHRLHR